MTRIRQRMIEDMKVRNLTPGKELRRAGVTGGAREGRPSPAQLLRLYCESASLVVTEPQSSDANLSSEYSIFFHQVINVDGRYTDCSRYHLKPVDGMRDETYTDGSFDSKNGIK